MYIKFLENNDIAYSIKKKAIKYINFLKCNDKNKDMQNIFDSVEQ